MAPSLSPEAALELVLMVVAWALVTFGILTMFFL
jgi:hypothetical protein